MSDSATDTTCYSVRHVPLHQHHDHMNSLVSLSGIETPQTAWRRNSKAISSPDVGSDTYSDAGIGIMNSGSSASTSGSCKMCEIHHRSHHGSSHHGAGSDDEHSSALSRKNSGGSGYQSNDSCCSPHQHAGHQRDHHRQHAGAGGGGGHLAAQHASPTPSSSCHCTSACSSCQTSLAGSLMSNRRSRPKLSLPTQHSHINLSAAGLGSPMENSSRSQSRGRSSSPQKVLLVSAVDKNGKVNSFDFVFEFK